MSVIAVSYNPISNTHTMAADTAVFFNGGLRARHRPKIRRFRFKHAPEFLFGYSGVVIYDRFFGVMENVSLPETTVKDCLRVLLTELEEWVRREGHGEVNDGVWSAPSFVALAVGSAGANSNAPATIYELSSGSIYEVLGRRYSAIGVGAELALGALTVGADAVSAVNAACEHHTQCHVFGDGPQVEVV